MKLTIVKNIQKNTVFIEFSFEKNWVKEGIRGECFERGEKGGSLKKGPRREARTLAERRLSGLPGAYSDGGKHGQGIFGADHHAVFLQVLLPGVGDGL